MKLVGKAIIGTLFALIFSLNVYAACVSNEIVEKLNNISSTAASLFVAGTHKETTVMGRTMLKIVDLDIGVPKKVELKRSKNTARMFEILDAGGTNLDLMKAGLTPIGPDGLRVNLHHLLGLEPGPLGEIYASQHREYTKELHGMIEASFRRDESKRDLYKAYQKRYWQERAKDYATP